jgi:hypothetical protein
MTRRGISHRPIEDRGGGWSRVGWVDVLLPALLVVAVSVPTMWLEEDWHGRPMIDQPNDLWVVAGCLVAGAFLAAGVIIGRRRPSGAVLHAAAAAAIAVGVLLGCALYRRFAIVHDGLPLAVARLWIYGVAASLSLGIAGAAVGRRTSRTQGVLPPTEVDAPCRS